MPKKHVEDIAWESRPHCVSDLNTRVRMVLRWLDALPRVCWSWVTKPKVTNWRLSIAGHSVNPDFFDDTTGHPLLTSGRAMMRRLYVQAKRAMTTRGSTTAGRTIQDHFAQVYL